MNSKSAKIKSKSISILLGAGFSAPQGYPVGKEMNCKLLNFDDNKKVSFSLSGELGTYTDERKENSNNEMYNSYYRYFIFCKRLIKEYNSKNKFDYEEFYDFIKSDKVKEKHYRDLFYQVFHYDESNKSEFENCVCNLPCIYSQMVEYLLKDKNGKNNYDDEPFKDSADGYDGFLKYLSQLITSEYIVNVHTLNHDLLFESFNNTKHINGCISDGFDKYGSEYYGELKFNNRKYTCLLKRYTGIYNTPIHLFKLHGSIDYLPYRDRLNDGKIDNYVKMEWGMDIEIFKTRKVKKRYDFISDHFEYHSDFLTGITSKIDRYETPPLFNKLFNRFKENLKVAEKLIIIGYGCKDSGINEIIKEHFNYQHKPSFIVDKYAGEGKEVQKFGKEINASIHKIDVDSINSDLF